VGARGSGSGKSVGCLVEGAKGELCLLLHGAGWERASGQYVRSPEVDGTGPIVPVIERIE